MLLQLPENKNCILYYDKPILYTVVVQDKLVLGSYLDENELFTEYIHVINDELIPLYLSGKLNLLDLFKAESSVLYLSWKEETFYHKLIQFSDIPSDELPMISYLQTFLPHAGR